MLTQKRLKELLGYDPLSGVFRWISISSPQARSIHIGDVAGGKNGNGRGYASAAVRELMQLHPGEFYANVAPGNMPSHALFTGMGAKLVQMTYRFGG